MLDLNHALTHMADIPLERWLDMISSSNAFMTNHFQGVSGCHGYGGAQLFRLNTEGQLASGEWCVNADKADNVHISWCLAGRNDGPWQFKENDQLFNNRMNKCLAVHPDTRLNMISTMLL